jgi:hypothetical protein
MKFLFFIFAIYAAFCLCREYQNLNSIKVSGPRQISFAVAEDESTQKPLLNMKSYYTREEAFDSGFECNPGVSVKVECNTCGCGDDGKVSWCTRVHCQGDAWKKPRAE